MNMYNKVFKAEFQFPPWFSAEPRRLISKILVSDPERRTMIPAIMQVPWFRKEFSRPFAFHMEEPVCEKSDEEEQQKTELENSKTTVSSPKFFNAFEFISSMSSGFDLSGLFEKKRKTGSVFTSKCSATAIMSKIETVAKGLSFKVAKVKDFRIRLQGPSEGRKGRLLVTAEVFQVAPEVAVVEFSKSSGDTLEYAKFCDDDIRPALKDIVWTWQGESMCNGNIKSGYGQERQKASDIDI